MTHSPTCNGCPLCNSVFAALAAAPPREQAQFQHIRHQADMAQFAARQGRVNTAATPAVLAAAPRPVVPPVEEVPQAPSLVAAVNARRAANGRPTYNLDAPVFGGGPRPRPTVAADHGEPPDPPSLTDAIRNRRAR